MPDLKITNTTVLEAKKKLKKKKLKIVNIFM